MYALFTYISIKLPYNTLKKDYFFNISAISRYSQHMKCSDIVHSPSRENIILSKSKHKLIFHKLPEQLHLDQILWPKGFGWNVNNIPQSSAIMLCSPCSNPTSHPLKCYPVLHKYHNWLENKHHNANYTLLLEPLMGDSILPVKKHQMPSILLNLVLTGIKPF